MLVNPDSEPCEVLGESPLDRGCAGVEWPVTTVRLPWPPAVNNLYANIGSGRVRTARYCAWAIEAAQAIQLQRVVPVRGQFCARLVFARPDRRIRDLDGLAKAPLDALVKAGAIQDDHLAQEILLAWSEEPPARPGSVMITLKATRSDREGQNA